MRKSEKRVMGFQHERKAMRKTHYCASTPPNVSPPPPYPQNNVESTTHHSRRRLSRPHVHHDHVHVPIVRIGQQVALGGGAVGGGERCDGLHRGRPEERHALVGGGGGVVRAVGGE